MTTTQPLYDLIHNDGHPVSDYELEQTRAAVARATKAYQDSCSAGHSNVVREYPAHYTAWKEAV